MTAILLLPLSTLPPEILPALMPALSAAFGCSCLIGAPMDLPAHAFDLERRQYRADAVVAAVEPVPDRHVLGIADADLYVPRMNFVFGLADPPYSRAVLALARLRPEWYRGTPDHELFLARTVKEAMHELGHTYGLGHCTDRRCVMVFSNSLLDTDFKEARFCPSCRKRLTGASTATP